MKTTKTARSLKPAHILVGSILALVALPAQPAQAVPLVTTDLKGYWSFDTDPGGGVVPETSGAVGGPRNGLFVGTPTYTGSDVPVGFTGSAADLRSNRSIKVDDGAGNTYFNGGSEMTVSFWKKGGFGNMWGAYVGKDGGNSGFRLIPSSNDTNPQTLGFGRTGATNAPWQTKTSLNTVNQETTWFNYTFTFKANNTANIYENGILIGTAGAGIAMIANSAPLGIGGNFLSTPGNNPEEQVSSRMDEVYFYNKQLTALQTMQLTGGHIWDGTAADNNWSTGNWAVPSGAPGTFTAGATPTASRYMFIDQAASNVALNDDYTAYSLSLGINNASALTINATKTLTSTLVVNVGASGTLQVDGGLTTTTFDNRGSSTFSAGSVLTFSGAGSSLALRSGTLTYNSTTPATPATVKFFGGALAGTGVVNATAGYEVWANTNVTLNLGGATTTMNIKPNVTATLTGTNTYGGQTYVENGARLNVVPGVGLPSGSNLRLVDNSTIAWSGDLIRPSGTGAGQMQVQSRHAHSAFGGPARLGFGTQVGPTITLENLIWNTGSFNHSEGWYLQRSDATHPLEVMNPIQLSTVATGFGSSSIFIQSGTQPVTFSGVLSGALGRLTLSNDFGGSSGGRMILTSPDNSYTGKTTIQTGSIEIGGAGRLGLGNYAGSIDILNASTFKYNSSANQILAGVVGGINGKLIKDGAGTLTLATGNNYTGTTTVTNGVLRLDDATALPGGIAGGGGGSALTLNGGVVGLGNGDFTRGLGTGAAQVRFTGSGGFAAYTADRTVDFGGVVADVTWGTGSFVPNGQALILGAADATHLVTVLNPLDLGTAGRTIHVNDGITPNADDGMLAGAITGTFVTNIGDSGGLTKTGTGSLRLEGDQSYNYLTADGGTTNVNGALTTLTAEVAVNNPGTVLRFGTVSQTLGSLTIGADATVIFTSGQASGSFSGSDKGAGFGSPASGFGGGATVPEPGTLGLLLVGALGMLNRRRRP
jgi:autotransporter-associated beta strand protein